ncbi:putative dioxygenase of extradiol dioxygenase family [Shewanella psychrophila]|uniref:Putative dioxygenase of extradiol dioxygenase family n=1 Tax=Shewanella psychrophila TaxID=225848 RepID=A0A1S6HIU3_9GAMM|nr:iron-containing redox enzyme family protein [Shewanella psychrophila]AQS35453.1 putative dioxygenase of extradiol dioxygenase family [Shewanella psychrophila]
MNIESLKFAGVDEFWAQADQLQDESLLHAETLFSALETASPQQLISILTQYRFFTLYYVADLAILIARLKDGRLRSLLADILSDELGYGDPLKAHTRLYDDFLLSLGANDADFDSLALADNLTLLENARRKLMDPAQTHVYGIGFRGMGGECTCQIYLAKLYEYMMRNPYIKQQTSKIDWKFWELHIGEHDIEHRVHTRQLIHEELVSQDAACLVDLGRGYYESMNAWRAFWENIFNQNPADSLLGQASASVEDLRLMPSVLSGAEERGLKQARVPEAIAQFHLAIPVHELSAAKEFYCDVLGAKEGRATEHHLDVNFYGHHLVLHATPEGASHIFDFFEADFHGESVQIPHFGINLDRQTWSQLAKRITLSGYEFQDAPHIRLKGLPGEHASMFILDPSGNALEFKAFLNHDEVFSKVFNPQTKELFGLEELMVKVGQ